MHIIEGLTEQQQASWTANGYLILPGFYSPEQVDELDAVTDWLWREKPTSMTVDSTVASERKRFSDIDITRDGNRLKLNDTFLFSETVRRRVLDERITPILGTLLGDDPVLINTLTLELGSTQGPHVDSLFMTPLSDDGLIATWTALEDVAIDAGPLFYYSGSHLLEPYRFSSGLQRLVPGEFDNWWHAIHSGLNERKIEREVFLAKKGDVFVWHARLVHGGSEILSPARTRKSLVAHFFTKTDCVYHDMPIRRCGNGYWFNRSEQPAPIHSDPPMIAPGPVVQRTFAKSRRDVSINVDYVTLQREGRRFARKETVEVDRSDCFLVRGWAADLERKQLLGSVLIETSRGVYIEARSSVGREDLLNVFGIPSFTQAGFLASIPAAMLQPGANTLRLFATNPHDGSLHACPRETIQVDVR